MKIPENCSMCLADRVCGAEHGSEECQNFQNTIESKLHSHNTERVQSLCDTGHATVEFDDVEEKPYWVTYDEGSKDGFSMDYDKPLTMLPSAFPVGTIIRVFEPENE